MTTSVFCSASASASRTQPCATSKSTISHLRTWPDDRLPDAQQGQRAVGPDFPHGGGDLGAADFKCDDDIA